MKKVIGIIASDEELKGRIEKLYSKDIKNGNIIMDLIKVDLLEEQGKILVDKGAQVIIGRGGGYKLILDTVNVPIIPLNMKIIDLLKAIKIASNSSKKIVLILGYDEIDFNYSDWRDIVNIEITEEWFKSKYEIRNRVIKYINQKEDVVIVGSGIACSFARQYKMDSIFINASEDSIKEAIEYSKKLLDSLEEEKFNNEVLRNILDGVKDGVIAIDTKGNIVLCNESAKNILKATKKNISNKPIGEVFSNMDWLLECLYTGEGNKMQIRQIDNLVVNTRAVPMKVDGEIQGVLGVLQDITKLQKLERKIRVDLNEKGLYAKHTFSDYIYKDNISKEFIEEAKKFGKSDYTTLLYGESGSGKEIVAQSIHNISKRKDKPFVAINCATISESLLESELFGYEEGAFTGARKGGKPGLFELAHGGTIFLDEVNSLPLYVQNKLLRVIEEKQIMRIGSDHIIPLDIRIIAATNEHLIEKINEKTFRADLFYRLSSLEINIPPLRKRKDDIVFLFEHFVKMIINKNTLNDLICIDENFELSKNETLKLESYDWPGNVRELRNIAQKYAITGKIKISRIESEEIRCICIDKEKEIKEHDELEIKYKVEGMGNNRFNIDIKEINKYVEGKIIDTLFNQGLSKTEVANILGISRTALWKKNKNA